MKLLMVISLVGCAAAAETTYTGQRLSCVERSDTRAKAQACIDDVDRRWCVVDGSPGQCADGGAP